MSSCDEFEFECDEVEPDFDGNTTEESISDDSSDDESESDSDDADDLPTAAGDFSGGVWSSIVGDDPGPTPIPFTAHPGPKHAPANASPIDYVKLFLDDALVDIICNETNRYADQWIRSHADYLAEKPRSRVHQWIKQGRTTPEEIYAFLSVSINMGLIKKSTLDSYYDTVNPSQSTPWFVERFSRDRFGLISKFLHFNDNTHLPPPTDPSFQTYKILPLIDHFNSKFIHHYHPHKHVSIDESMIGYKGKTPHLRQYMPNKHHARFGIKLWCLCDSSTHYTSVFEVYKGVTDPRDRTAEGMTYSLVIRIMTAADLLHRGHHLGLDNFFTSPKLLDDLYDAHTTSTGTVRRNRKGLPKSVITAKLANKQVIERRRGDLLCVGYKDGSKQPILLSTEAAGGFSTSRNSKGKERLLPNSVIVYNKSMGGVDMSDARLYAYLSERRTMKWTTKVAFSLIGRAVLNAYILYKECCDTRPITRLQFNVQVVESLMGSYRPPNKIRRRRRTQQEIAEARVVIDPPVTPVQPGTSKCTLVRLQPKKQRNCVYHHAKRTRSVYQCANCNVGLCATCFGPYHEGKGLRH